MIVVNLFAGPGAGKSTTAAGIFSLLKMHGINAELITEFAKNLTWEKREVALQNQYYVWAKQYHGLFRVGEQADIIITDSPMPLSVVYGHQNGYTCQNFYDLIMDTFNKFTNINFFVNRDKPYNPAGRCHTEEESKKLDVYVKETLKTLNIKFEEVGGNYKGINYITHTVLNKFFNKSTLEIMLTDYGYCNKAM